MPSERYWAWRSDDRSLEYEAEENGLDLRAEYVKMLKAERDRRRAERRRWAEYRRWLYGDDR